MLDAQCYTKDIGVTVKDNGQAESMRGDHATILHCVTLLIFNHKNDKIRVPVDLVFSHPVHNRHKIVVRWMVKQRISHNRKSKN